MARRRNGLSANIFLRSHRSIDASSTPYMIESLPNEIDDRWILAQRSQKNVVDPSRPYHFLTEQERAASGEPKEVAVIFLTNRECPFRCLFCDLWKNTTDASVPEGAIPAQIQWALERLPRANHIKLYNSGNFFDRAAIPRGDLPRIANIASSFETLIIENHPKLLNEACLDFKQRLAPRLEVAMGLETVHPTALARFNKHMTIEDFEAAARLLVKHDIGVRAFILLRPPFLDEREGILWAKRSIEFAFEVGVECCVVIPTRTGNGALDQLKRQGLFTPPHISSLEEVVEFGIRLNHGRVFADLWDAERFGTCRACAQARIVRLQKMNHTQQIPTPIQCEVCDAP
jgi:radical SAM enzyme (TIGR01210 family)